MSQAGILEQIESIDVGIADRATVEAGIAQAGVVERRAVQTRLALLRRLSDLAAADSGLCPELVNAQATLGSMRSAALDTKRVAALDDSPSMAKAFTAGTVSVEHVDVLANAANQLPVDQRARLLADNTLGVLAEGCTPEAFSRLVRIRARSISVDDGLQRCERQRRARSLRHWVERDTGMICFRGALDPEAGLSFLKRLDAQV
ncbi:MAG: DUF222 domain-containing protein, partial [Ilumatobacteraceae bacterium]